MSTKAKRFYWIKLKENFFDIETIDWLISQKNGCEYIVLYQKLCLLTANKEGKLAMQIGEMLIPYDVNKIARDTKFSIDTVIVAMDLFKKIGLIYEQEDGVLYIPYMKEIVGSETTHALKKRQQRERKKLKSGDNGGDNVRQEIENREKSLDIRDLELDEDVEKGANAPDYTDPDNQLQKFKRHLFLTENQMGDLLEKLGLENFDEYAFRLDDYIEKTGCTFKSHYQTLLDWYNEDRQLNK